MRNCIGTESSLFSFFGGSGKRCSILKQFQEESNAKSISLKRFCETRWASRDLSFGSVKEALPFILKSLEYIHRTDKTPSGSNAKPLLNACKNFDFLFFVHFLAKLFNLTSILSKCLQESSLDITKAKN